MEGNVVLTMRDISKTFPGVKALQHVDFTLRKGEIHALMGENGAGKSTLIKVLTGVHEFENGEIRLDGKDGPIINRSPQDAQNNGISTVYQEVNLCPNLTVAENIFLAELSQFRNKLGMINKKAMNQKATEAMRAIGVEHVIGDMPIDSLDFQTRKLVEIAKVMLKNPDILVIDETSTALSQDGREIMYSLIRKLRDSGKAIIFISHDLEEIMEVCDTLTVLRDGNLIRTFKKEEFNADEIRTSMIGRELQGDYYRSDFTPSSQKEAAITATNLKYKEELKSVSITLKKGEILGIGGLAACGMHTLGKAMFGALALEEGEVTTYDGTKINSPHIAVANKIGYVSKDRDVESLCLSASIQDNIAVGGMEKYAVNGFLITNKKEKEYVAKQIKDLSIKCSDGDQLTSQLSGGNKQKVVFGKWIGCGSEILILDCPTRGVDIGVKQSMYQLMMELKKEGKAILLISEELPELLGMSDRLLIMKDGSITGEFMRSESLTDADVIGYMI